MEGMNILSLGLGVQSTALYYMSSMGELLRCDYAIFADLGREKTETMNYLRYLQDWQKKNNGIPIIVLNGKNLYEDLLNQTNSTGQRFASIPAFTDGSIGMLRRQCTTEYKINPINKEIRRIYNGVGRLPKTNVWIGISLDEHDRMHLSKKAWRFNYYPFCGYKTDRKNAEKINTETMYRTEIMEWYNKHGLPIPVKSSCVFCPYQSDNAYLRMKRSYPEDFADACNVDEAIRDSSKKGIKQQIFLHRSCKPLKNVQFDELQTEWMDNCTDGCHI